jgi:hypothetical protein
MKKIFFVFITLLFLSSGNIFANTQFHAEQLNKNIKVEKYSETTNNDFAFNIFEKTEKQKIISEKKKFDPIKRIIEIIIGTLFVLTGIVFLIFGIPFLIIGATTTMLILFGISLLSIVFGLILMFKKN